MELPACDLKKGKGCLQCHAGCTTEAMCLAEHNLALQKETNQVVLISRGLMAAVRELSPISKVVGEQVQLRQSGAQLVGRCPLHADRTPSFRVHPGKQVYFCHGWGAGGDVFDFVKRLYRCSFVRSVQILAARVGIGIQGFKPSPELLARVGLQKAERELEQQFRVFRDDRVWAITNKHRQLSKSALHAEDFLRGQSGFEGDLILRELAWDALERYVTFSERIEREGLLDSDVLRAEWRTQRGEHRADA